MGRSESLLQALDGGWPNTCCVGIRATARGAQGGRTVLALAGCRDTLWLPATSSFASCGRRSRLSDEPDLTRRGSSFPAGRSKTTSFLSSRCTPAFVTFCNFKCSHCVNHVQFFPTNAEKFPGLGIAFTKCFVSESHSGAVVARAGGIDLRFDVRSSPLLHQLDAPSWLSCSKR